MSTYSEKRGVLCIKRLKQMVSLFYRSLHRLSVCLFVLACVVSFSNCKSDTKSNEELTKVEISNESEEQVVEGIELSIPDTAIELTTLKNGKVDTLIDIDVSNQEEQTRTIPKEAERERLEPIKIIDKHLYKSKIDYSNIDKYYLISLIEERLNNQRMSKGLRRLYQRRNLKDAAQDQNDYVNHLSSLTHIQDDAKKSTVRDRVSHHGGRYMKVGENIQYYGFLNNDVNGEVFIFPPDYSEAADDIIKVWNESPGHYKNMMDKDFSSVGTALDWNAELKAIFVTQVYGG